MLPRVVWRFTDGKAGHDAQSRGLVEALARLTPVVSISLEPLATGTAIRALLGYFPPAWGDLPNPDLIVGAGRAVHLSLLAAREVRGGKIVVLMRPSLPWGLFDLCLIPEHDAPPVRANVVTTRGALNRIQPSKTLDRQQGMFLIGGPSTHFAWDNARVWQQIAAIVRAHPTGHWTLTTSRRTPANFLEFAKTSIGSWWKGFLPNFPFSERSGRVIPPARQSWEGDVLSTEADRDRPPSLEEALWERISIVPFSATLPDWLPAQLTRAGQVWVTAHPLSMIYEALTAGAAVGILDLPPRRSSLVSRGLIELARACLL
ncbi:MAG: mitochondrial fission ELM1 family protein, partial [Kiritimatiellae bacterium]|nr:mitochondrial fission ELM1 family protein [Kiritimatiellia bacterium]